MQLTPREERIRRSAEDLRNRLEAAGRYVTFDGRVKADVAAEILNLSENRLKYWRMKGGGPTYIRMKTPWYALPDLIEWLEEQKKV